MFLQIRCIQLDMSLWILHALCSNAAVSAAVLMNSGLRPFAESGLIIWKEQILLELWVSKVP